MIKKLIIFGAGSIGNHYANAAKKLGLDVEVFDTSEAALLRMKKSKFIQKDMENGIILLSCSMISLNCFLKMT